MASISLLLLVYVQIAVYEKAMAEEPLTLLEYLTVTCECGAVIGENHYIHMSIHACLFTHVYSHMYW